MTFQISCPSNQKSPNVPYLCLVSPNILYLKLHLGSYANYTKIKLLQQILITSENLSTKYKLIFVVAYHSLSSPVIAPLIIFWFFVYICFIVYLDVHFSIFCLSSESQSVFNFHANIMQHFQLRPVWPDVQIKVYQIFQKVAQ